MDLELEIKREVDPLENTYQKGVIHLSDIGITKLPNKYILPVIDQPNTIIGERNTVSHDLKIPVIDFNELQGPKRFTVLESLGKACREYGFFQVINHSIPSEVLHDMIEIVRQFFRLPLKERAQYMSADVFAPVRYGTSFNQNSDGIFCWRDFLKLMCHPLSEVLPFWPSSPTDFRQAAVTYSKQIKAMFLILMKAVIESLGISTSGTDEEDILKQFEDGSQLMVVNCYPSCPEPNLTLGMPPHSDYGFLTLLLQDDTEGLQIQYEGTWIDVKPLHNSFVVNVGDHLEIFSNGRYKSALHRVLVNSSTSRVSVASLHSLSFNTAVQPSPKLIDRMNPRRYKDTDFASFLEYLASCESKKKNFLESRKLNGVQWDPIIKIQIVDFYNIKLILEKW